MAKNIFIKIPIHVNSKNYQIDVEKRKIFELFNQELESLRINSQSLKGQSEMQLLQSLKLIENIIETPSNLKVFRDNENVNEIDSTLVHTIDLLPYLLELKKVIIENISNYNKGDAGKDSKSENTKLIIEPNSKKSNNHKDELLNNRVPFYAGMGNNTIKESTQYSPVIEDKKDEKVIHNSLISILKTIGIILLLFLLFQIGLFIYKTIDKEKFALLLKEFFMDFSGQTVGSFIIISIGIILYLFKRDQQFWYGIIETLFALFGCYASSFLIKTIVQNQVIEPTYLVAFGSSIYLVVRGLSNVEDGIKKDFWLKSTFASKSIRSIIDEISESHLVQSELFSTVIKILNSITIKF